MMLLLGSVGCGLFLVGAVGHILHHARLRQLLGHHTDRPELASRAIVALELGLVAILIGVWIGGADPARWAAVALAALVTVGFTAWVGRLWMAKSDLPCACSFGSQPTSGWSVARAIATGFAALMPFAASPGAADSTATVLTGIAIATALYIGPDTLAWPDYALRIRRYTEANRPSPVVRTDPT